MVIFNNQTLFVIRISIQIPPIKTIRISVLGTFCDNVATLYSLPIKSLPELFDTYILWRLWRDGTF